jgi:hypothetical protein
VEEEGNPLPILLQLVVGQRHPDHHVLAVAVSQGQLPPVPLLPILVCVLVLRLHRLVGQVEVVVGEAAVHLLLLLLGSMVYLDPLLLPPRLLSPARICHQDTLMTLAWGVLLRAGQVRSRPSSLCKT